MPLVPSVAAGLFLARQGCDAGDALWSALTVLRYLFAIAACGTLFSLVAVRIMDRAAGWKAMFGPACAAVAWAPFVFLLLLALYRATGAGAPAALYAGLTLLLWGVAAGTGIIGGEEGGEPGRLLVASCLGLSGCILGMFIAHRAPPPAPVLHERAPFTSDGIARGDFLLVRRGKNVPTGAIVLLRKRGSRQPLFARVAPDGKLALIGKVDARPNMLREWDIMGRVFFRLGSWHATDVVPSKQSPNVSQD